MSNSTRDGNPSRIIELGCPTGKVQHTITVRPILGYFPEAGTANSLMGGLPTRGKWRELGDWTIEVKHVSGDLILYPGWPYSATQLARELTSALSLLEGWTILSDDAGILEIGTKAS